MTPAGAMILGRLTPKEAEITRFAVQGMSNREIALQIHTTEQVVKNYMRRIFDKSGADGRVDLILRLIYHGAVDCPCERCRAAA